MKITFLKPKPNWGHIKFSDSFIFEMYHWNQSIRHNYETGVITFYRYDKSWSLASLAK